MNEKTGRIFILSGPAGSGKNSVYDGLCKLSDSIAQTVSATTRKPRINEKDGVDYYFISQADFLRRIENGDFLEYVNYGGNYYGTLKSELPRLSSLGKTAVLIIDVNGACRIKEEFPAAVTIFIVPPSADELLRRITDRGGNTAEEIHRRMEIAQEEMKLRCKYDYCVINDSLQNCVETVYNIIENRNGEIEND